MAKAKEIDGLDCAMRAGDGINLILRSRLEEMCSFRAAALEWSDVEGVHDMRVASRRLRSAIKDFLPYLRRRKLRQAREELRRVARSLGAVRDQDVALIALEKLEAAAPSELSGGVEQFASARRRQLDDARAHLEEVLSAEALEKLRLDFNDALAESSKPTRGGDGDGEEAADELKLEQVARAIVEEKLRDLQDLSASLFQPFEPEPLHRMRIAAKRLRYAIELFTPCLGGDALKPFCKEIARMQDSLGELHDCDVWIAEIGAALKEAAADELDAESFGGGTKIIIASDDGAAQDGRYARHGALCWLLDYFVKERTDHYRAALERWREWEATAFDERLIARIHHQPHEARPSAETSADAQTAAQIISREHE